MLNILSTCSFALVALSTLSLASLSPAGKQRLSCSIIPDSNFPVLNYDSVQISSTPSGDALERANKLCVEPFNGLNLKDVTRDELNNLNSFFQDAENAEVQKFVPLLATLSGGRKLQLQRGITKNKILKLVCDIQVAKIKTAQNNPQHDDITVETKKLNHNLALEAAQKGQVARSFLDF